MIKLPISADAGKVFNYPAFWLFAQILISAENAKEKQIELHFESCLAVLVGAGQVKDKAKMQLREN